MMNGGQLPTKRYLTVIGVHSDHATRVPQLQSDNYTTYVRVHVHVHVATSKTDSQSVYYTCTIFSKANLELVV